MKHFSSALFIFLIISASVFAQTTAISLKGGYNTNWLFNKNLKDDAKISFGYTGGLSFIWYGIPLNYYSDRLFGLAIDALYATHNQEYQGQISVPDTPESRLVDYSRTINLTYVDIPLYFRLAQDQGATYFEIGPQYSILMSATETFAVSDNTIPSYTDKDIKENLPPNAWAVMAGYGFDFPVNLNLFITAGARVTYGFTDITKHMQGSSADYKPTKRATAGLNVSVMYRFNSYHSSKARVNKRR